MQRRQLRRGVGQAADPVPRLLHLGVQRVDRGAVVDDEVGVLEPRLARGLPRDACARVGLDHPAVLHQPLNRNLDRCVHHDEAVHAVHPNEVQGGFG